MGPLMNSTKSGHIKQIGLVKVSMKSRYFGHITHSWVLNRIWSGLGSTIMGHTQA